MMTLQVNASTTYEIVVGRNLLPDCGAKIKKISAAETVVIVTDDIVEPLYGSVVRQSLEAEGFRVATFVFPHGEQSKSHHTLIALYDFLCDQSVTRGDLLIALGGGVVGDLTGFCAATYLRGIDYVQIPTTLLAQIDSSVGGKTAVDTEKGKNLVGAFKQPSLVLCDVDTLDTLTPEIFADGMAEAIKYGLIKDKKLFEMIAENDISEILENMIYQCIKIKAQVVEADEFDKGERMLLNFGHTIGHAIERQYHYQTYTHGTAVGVGMVYISALSEQAGLTPKGTTEAIKRCLHKYQLPCSVKITPEQILGISSNDKKRDKNDINLILLKEIGQAFISKMSLAEYAKFLQCLPTPAEQAVITPSALSGTVQIPPSKSYAHRALISAALADGVSVIHNIAHSEDIDATVSGLTALGAKFEFHDHAVTVHGIRIPAENAKIDCWESGSTLRFLVPVAAALGTSCEFSGKGKLPSRPLRTYIDCFAEKAVSIQPDSGMPFRLTGKLKPGKFSLSGNISSQFITGLLFALPLLEGDSEIVLTSPLESVDYVNMTLEMLRLAGIEITYAGNGYRIKGNQHYHPFTYTVEGDYSQAAFFFTAAAIGSPISCQGLNPHSLQGDKKMLDILKQAGAEVLVSGNTVTVSHRSLQPFTVDAKDIPDIVPILSVLAAHCAGESQIIHIERLKYKESDRIQTTAALLKSLGAEVSAYDDRLVIQGGKPLCGGVVDSFRDHRIAMSAAVAALQATSFVTILHAEAVNKSYPNFFEDYNQLGGRANVVPME